MGYSLLMMRHNLSAWATKLLSNRGTNLLSDMIQDICHLMGMRKMNTTAHHLQTDGLVENFNRTLCSMAAKHARKFESRAVGCLLVATLVFLYWT